jgi:hypothetical protein
MAKQKGILPAIELILLAALLAAPAMADSIAVNAGNGQSAIAGTAVYTLPSVFVEDAYNNPVSGVPVTFAVMSGGGSVTGSSVTTGGDGIATAGSWILGTTAGINTLAATSGSLTGSPVTFTALGTAGPATQVASNSATSQSAAAGTAVAAAPAVIIRDAYNNLVSGVPVTFAVMSGGGSVTGWSVTTGANGVATAGSWILGTTAGTNTLAATSGSLTGSPVIFTATGTSATSTPVISTITPSSGINNGYIRSVDIHGTGFVTGAAIRLVKPGQSNITMVNPSITFTDITCDFNLIGVPAGTWDVVLVNADGVTVTDSGGFTVVNASTVATVTSIIPASGMTNTTVTITNLAGTGFQSNARMRLTRSGYNDIISTVSSVNSTSVAGAFDLNGQTPGTYIACVLYDGTNRVCGPIFTINAASSVANGSIFFKSTPYGSTVYLNNSLVGITPFTLYNVTPGYYGVRMQQSGYHSYSGSVTVTAGSQVSVYQNMVAAATATVTQVTHVPTRTASTPVPPAKKTTKPVPTAWPTGTPTPASPASPAMIIGAIGIAILMIKK